MQALLAERNANAGRVRTGMPIIDFHGRFPIFTYHMVETR